MRAAIISHSLIHLRQLLFIEELRRQGGEVLAVFPERWGDQHRKGGYTIYGSGIEDFNFMAGDAFAAINRFEPQIIYIMAEWWQKVSWQARRWAKLLNVPLIFFFWENLRAPNKQHGQLINSAELVVCGNKECEELVKGYAQDTVVLPQVGIDILLFREIHIHKKYDIIFVGRHVKEKGIEYVEKLKKDGYSVYEPFGKKYEEMPPCYNQAKVQVVPTLDTPQWKEQGPMCVAESLACNVPVVAFDSGSIYSNYETCFDISFAEQGNYEELRDNIKFMLEQHEAGGRDWVMENMSNEVIAKKLIQEFEKLVNP